MAAFRTFQQVSLLISHEQLLPCLQQAKEAEDARQREHQVALLCTTIWIRRACPVVWGGQTSLLLPDCDELNNAGKHLQVALLTDSTAWL